MGGVYSLFTAKINATVPKFVLIGQKEHFVITKGFVKYIEGRELPFWPKSTDFQPIRPILSPKWAQRDTYHNVLHFANTCSLKETRLDESDSMLILQVEYQVH
jgi:hypothetical protein